MLLIENVNWYTIWLWNLVKMVAYFLYRDFYTYTFLYEHKDVNIDLCFDISLSQLLAFLVNFYIDFEDNYLINIYECIFIYYKYFSFIMKREIKLLDYFSSAYRPYLETWFGIPKFITINVICIWLRMYKDYHINSKSDNSGSSVLCSKIIIMCILNKLQN